MGVQLAARLQRPRHAHGVDGGRHTTSRHRARGRVRHDQRHRAARAHRGLQGAAGRRRRTAAASSSTAWRPSTRPSPTASTSSTTRSAARDQLPRRAVEIAFLFAADAGVFVAASAGNSGPTTSTVAHPGPVAHDGRRGHAQPRRPGSVTLGNGATYSGASRGDRRRPRAVHRLDGRRPAGADPAAGAVLRGGRQRGPAVLDPAKVAGKIVVCDRGVNAASTRAWPCRRPAASA